MNRAEMESIRMSMIGQEQHLAEALECCRQIRMEAERMEKAYSETKADLRAMLIMDQLDRKDAEEERLRQGTEGKPFCFPTDDKPLTAEEREEKHRMIPTRIATKTGMWEILSEYKGDETLVGFMAKKEHKFGPIDSTAFRLALTVEEWNSLFDEIEPALMLMVL